MEIGYCIISKEGKIIAPFIPSLKKDSHFDEYKAFLEKEHPYLLDSDNDIKDEFIVSKMSFDLASTNQSFLEFKYINHNDWQVNSFKHISDALNFD